MRINVYIDGFNLYYGCLKNSPYLWLDLHKMCSLLFPHDEIIKIKYFTAPIKTREGSDPDKANRQQIYLRALRTIPRLEIIEGFFLSHNVSMKLANKKGFVDVVKSEEKGTDVNIATHLIHDAHTNSFERAVVISNDSDLVTPIRIVSHDLNLPVTVISPFEKNNIQLKTVATNVKQIRKGLLRVSQFSEKLTDNIGDFYIPEIWKKKWDKLISHQKQNLKFKDADIVVGDGVFTPDPNITYSTSIIIDNLPPLKGLLIADIGTGCGVLAVASALQGARKVVATDISGLAIENTRENIKLNGVENIVETFKNNLLNDNGKIYLTSASFAKQNIQEVIKKLGYKFEVKNTTKLGYTWYLYILSK